MLQRNWLATTFQPFGDEQVVPFETLGRIELAEVDIAAA
jgi:hypothetical protein